MYGQNSDRVNHSPFDLFFQLHGLLNVGSQTRQNGVQNIDLKGKDNESKQQTPEVANLVKNLKTQENKEKNLKRIRKEQDMEEAIPKEVPSAPIEQPVAKETPEIDLKEGLTEPKAPVAPIKPV